MPDITFRFAERSDIPLILQFIRDLAIYEKLEHEVSASESLLAKWLFDTRSAEVMFALVDNREAGFTLFFTSFSTFLGKPGLYLEDLFVKPEYRGQGIGKALLSRLARIAVERDYGRMEWMCLDWNEPSIEFYLALGAEQMGDWTKYRLAGDTLSRAARLCP